MKKPALYLQIHQQLLQEVLAGQWPAGACLPTEAELAGEPLDDKSVSIAIQEVADGKLEVLLVEKVSRLKVAGIIAKYKAGRYRELPDLVQHFTTDRLTIRCDNDTAINLDGELRRAKVINISVAEEKIRFFYPASTRLVVKKIAPEAATV